MIYFLIMLSLAQAQTIKWEPQGEFTTGFKIYWDMVEECDLGFADNDFIYSVNVGEKTEYNFQSDPNFIIGKSYSFRLASYNSSGFESTQSEDWNCFKIQGASEVPKTKK